MTRVCHRLNRSRAAYYKLAECREKSGLQGQILKDLVLEYRKDMPRLGGRKLLHLLRQDMQTEQIKLGRDRFFNWLRSQDLLVQPKKNWTKTTNSSHRFRVYKNQIKELTVTRPDQVWVSDITYLRLERGFCYLALVTDSFSRKIIGYDVSDSLELSGCMRALAHACRKRINNAGIHHSDRGSQYCSNSYTRLLKKHNIQISMAEAGNCYENAQAERVNGILKMEFNLDRTFKDLAQARVIVAQAIHNYNCLRPHMALGLRKPNEVYAA